MVGNFVFRYGDDVIDIVGNIFSIIGLDLLDLMLHNHRGMQVIDFRIRQEFIAMCPGLLPAGIFAINV